MRNGIPGGLSSGLLLVAALLACAAAPAANVTTHHYDNFRSGWNWQEPALTPANVAGIGILATTAVDEQVDAQPLVLTNQSINGTVHPSVVYIATENNSVYALDGSSGAVLAQTHLETAVTVASVGGISGCHNNSVVVGINSTPVIDASNGTLYVVTATTSSGTVSYHLHALSVSSLADMVTPLAISTPTGLNRQRAALTLFNGGVLIPFTSFCDNPTSTFGALVYANITATPASQTRFGTTTTNLATIWMSGAGPAVYGNIIYFVTGNGAGPYPPTGSPSPNLPESLVALQGSTGVPLSLTFSSLFTPSNYASLDGGSDLDFGAGGALLIPSGAPASIVPGTTTANFVGAAGKYGTLYVNGLGLGSTPIQSLPLGGDCHCGESYFTGSSGTGYVVTSAATTLGLYSVSSSGLTLANSTGLVARYYGEPGYFTSVSSNGTAAGSALIWLVTGPTAANTVFLWAYDPTTLTSLVALAAGTWSSTGATANIVPVVANSKVYVASYKQVTIFGLAPYLDTPVMTIGGVPGGGGFSTVAPGLPAAGSMSPTTTANGYTYTDFYTRSPPRSGQINGFFSVSGFTSDPGQGWLISASVSGYGTIVTGSQAQYSYSNGTANWTNTGGAAPLPNSGTATCLVAHK
jgi:hypothetical protein